jgi:hypothetical protein
VNNVMNTNGPSVSLGAANPVVKQYRLKAVTKSKQPPLLTSKKV